MLRWIFFYGRVSPQNDTTHEFKELELTLEIVEIVQCSNLSGKCISFYKRSIRKRLDREPIFQSTFPLSFHNNSKGKFDSPEIAYIFGFKV